jgi:hypothetical protein
MYLCIATYLSIVLRPSGGHHIVSCLTFLFSRVEIQFLVDSTFNSRLFRILALIIIATYFNVGIVWCNLMEFAEFVKPDSRISL